MHERRSAQRLERRLPVACRVSGQEPFAAEMRDITGKGLRLDTAHEVASGAVLELAIDLQDRFAPLQMEGAVIWQGNGSLGLRFTKINHTDLRFFRLCFPGKPARRPV